MIGYQLPNKKQTEIGVVAVTLAFLKCVFYSIASQFQERTKSARPSKAGNQARKEGIALLSIAFVLFFGPAVTRSSCCASVIIRI